jgi:uncharacterized membrane protein
MLPIVSTWMLYLVSAIEVIAAILIGFASLQCAVTAARLFLQRDASTAAKEEVRLQFGLWLSLAIEFELAADILRTTVAPSWEEIGKLAAIVVLRTVLNYFLQTEIRRAALQNPARPLGKEIPT